SVWNRKSGPTLPIERIFQALGWPRMESIATTLSIVSRGRNGARTDMIEYVPTSTLCTEQCHLGEGATYDAPTDTAWWCSILESRLVEANVQSEGIRVHQLGQMGSALARIDATRQLIASDDGLYIRTLADGAMALYRELEADNPLTRSNDARVHPSGTFWIG